MSPAPNKAPFGDASRRAPQAQTKLPYHQLITFAISIESRARYKLYQGHQTILRHLIYF